MSMRSLRSVAGVFFMGLLISISPNSYGKADAWSVSLLGILVTYYSVGYQALDENRCIVLVLPGNTEDLELKAALNPDCTLKVSGIYYLKSAINLVRNKIQGYGAYLAEFPLIWVNSVVQEVSPDADVFVQKPALSEKVGYARAVFQPEAFYEESSLFYVQEKAEFDSVGFITQTQDGAEVALTISEEVIASNLVNTTAVDFSGYVPFLQCGRGGDGQKGGGANKGNQGRKSRWDQPSRWDKGRIEKRPPKGVGGGQPPKRPSKWDVKPGDNLTGQDLIRFNWIIALISTLEVSGATQQTIQHVHMAVSGASWKVKHELLKHDLFCKWNRTYQFIK